MDILSFFDRKEYIQCSTCGRLMKKHQFTEITKQTGICKSCTSHLPIIPVGTTFEETNIYIDYSMAAFFYKPPIRQLILDLKFKSCMGYAELLSKFMYDCFGTIIDEENFPDLAVPVPLSKERLKERGYNQAELLSAPFAKMLNIPHSTEAIIRIRNTKRQTDLMPWERSENLNNAFCADTKIIKNKSIVLIDDVYTTGSTVKECAKTLICAGAANVRVFTLARQRGMRKSKEYNELLSK